MTMMTVVILLFCIMLPKPVGSGKSTGFPVGAAIGGGIGAVLAVVAVVAVVIIVVRRKGTSK